MATSVRTNPYGHLRFYFSLQLCRMNRVIRETGFHPILGYLLLTILFAILSALFFLKVSYPEFIYPLLAFGVVQMTSGADRNQFLKIQYSPRDYRQLRLFENILMAVPFVLFLFCMGEWLSSVALLLFASCLSLVNNKGTINLVIPTPFSKWPFEFTVGFRNTFWIFLICYILTTISISVDNFNLGAFSLVVAFLTVMNFYSKPESSYYVWVHAASPQKFLNQKIKVALIYSFSLSLPMAIALLIYYPASFHIVLLIEALGLLFIITALVGKYAYYPSEVNLILGLSIGACILFPPGLLLAIPLFYRKATHNLNTLLK